MQTLEEVIAKDMTRTLRHHGVEMHPDDIRGLAYDALAALRSFLRSDEVVGLGWDALKESCCSDPEQAKRCVMVGKDDFRATLSSITEAEHG